MGWDRIEGKGSTIAGNYNGISYALFLRRPPINASNSSFPTVTTQVGGLGGRGGPSMSNRQSNDAHGENVLYPVQNLTSDLFVVFWGQTGGE